MYIQEPCVVDENIITATDPNTVREFAENIIAMIENKQYDLIER
jgi:putative intracellular protease/amidase